MSDDYKDRFLREVMENYPEVSTFSLRCVYWDYAGMKFKFVDEDGSTHEVDMEKLKKGLDLFIQKLLDSGQMDASDFDELVQYSIFGKLIYE
jgi:hypothetical protein